MFAVFLILLYYLNYWSCDIEMKFVYCNLSVYISFIWCHSCLAVRFAESPMFCFFCELLPSRIRNEATMHCQFDVLMQFCISTTILTMILKFCQIEVLGGTRSTNEKKSEFFFLKNLLFKFSKIDFFITTGPIGVKF